MADNHLFHYRHNMEYQTKQGPVKASSTALKDMSEKRLAATSWMRKDNGAEKQDAA
jgi:hypothetical protein